MQSPAGRPSQWCPGHLESADMVVLATRLLESEGACSFERKKQREGRRHPVENQVTLAGEGECVWGDLPLRSQHGEDVSPWIGKNAEQLWIRGEVSQQTQLHLTEVCNKSKHTNISVLALPSTVTTTHQTLNLRINHQQTSISSQLHSLKFMYHIRFLLE